MARIAAARDTHLTREEIAATALRLFDSGSAEPTMRTLANELKVAPTAIYHHYASRAALFQSVVELVWAEAMLGVLAVVPDPFSADPIEVLVETGLSTRRAWLQHHRVSRYMAATPEANKFVLETVGLMANLFERLGLEGEEAAAAFHSYSSFMIGAVLFAADRKTANEQLAEETGSEWAPEYRTSGDGTRTALDTMMIVSVMDPEQDQLLFERGLRRMIESFTALRP